MEVLNDDTHVMLSKGVDVDVCLPLFFILTSTFLGMIKNMTESSYSFFFPQHLSFSW